MVIGTITWLKQHNPHYADFIPNDEWYSSITNSELAMLVHEDAVDQEGSELAVAVTNTRTQTHDPDLDNEENTHEQQITDDILNIEGNKAVVIENTKNDNEESDNELQEEQAALDCKHKLTGDALPSVVQIENLENRVYQCASGENNTPKYMLLDCCVMQISYIGEYSVFSVSTATIAETKEQCSTHTYFPTSHIFAING